MSIEDEQRALLRRVLDEHHARPHPDMTASRLRLHATLHVVAETQIANNDPPVVARTLRRLMDAGLDRHAAIHAIGSVVAREVLQAVDGPGQYEEQRYTSALDALSAADWLDE